MGELLLIVIAAALVNNFVLVQFLGLCPFMGASRRLEGAIGMALATGLVLTTASGLCFLVDRFVLQRFDLQYLRILAFVAVVGASILLTNALVRRFSPLLHRVLGVALLNSAASRSFVAALFYGAGASLGFGIALALIAGLRERLTHADVPMPFRGAAIVFVTAGILSLAFLGFAGFARL